MQKSKFVKLKMPTMPTTVGELIHSNQFLKFFSITTLLLVFMAFGVIFVLMTKEPIVITLGPDGKAIERTMLPKAEDQIREGIKRYLEKRYQWEPSNVIKKLKESEEFIHPKAINAFRNATANVSTFSVEKVVSQSIYPNKIEIDLKSNKAIITGDRITSIQGLKAAGNLKLELTFESGSRTKENPWGLYISKEREE